MASDWWTDLVSLAWLSRIVPVRIVPGTPGPDTLSAQFPGDVVLGLAGNDTLTSTVNRTALLGGRDDDHLTTNVVLGGPGGGGVHALAIQLGGSGRDTLDTTVAVQGGAANAFGDPLRADVYAAGNSGNDIIHATAHAVDFTFSDTTLRTHVFGGAGDDTLTVTADARGVIANGNAAINTVDAGSGNDRVVALAITEFVGENARAINCLTGGDGSDFLQATATAASNSTELAKNFLDGDRGNDILIADNTTNSNSRAPVGINKLIGGDGDDRLTGTHNAFDNTISDVTNLLDGGNGKDTLVADSTAQGTFVHVANLLDGGNQNDTLTATATVVSRGGGTPPPNFPNAKAYDVLNDLTGGVGADILTATLSVSDPFPPSDGSRAENHLNGGAGKDVLLATVAPGSPGASFLDGGADDDKLTVFGGTGNVLRGGAGKDVLVSGTGDDLLIGGSGFDTLTFRPGNGNDIADFTLDRDRIDLRAFAAVGIHGITDLDINAAGGNSLITFDADALGQIKVLGVTSLTVSDFWFA